LSDIATFDFPVFVTAPPGDHSRLFVVEKRGTIQVVALPSASKTLFLDLRGAVSTGSEQGLLGLAFHPDFATNRRFVVDYTNPNGDTRISLFQTSATNPDQADPASETVLLAIPQPFANHNGGMVTFGPDGMLYIGMGDGGSVGDPQGNGQKRSTLLGKLLRIGVTAGGQVAIPADNPFVGQADARGEIWSLGLRNPWRFSFDRATGDLYLGDVGQGAREEVDVAASATGGGRGLDYGWNVMEGTSCYNASTCDQSGLTLPVLDYTHDEGCSITGGYVYRGAIAAIRGQYFYADYCEGWVRSFKWANGAVTETTSWADLAPGGPITSFGEDAAGELYLMTSTGRVARIVERP
jgi:glucose/arabinose dehydrogenase